MWTTRSGIEANSGMQLSGVSCTSATSCTVVGHQTEITGEVTTVAEYWNGTTWTRKTTPNEFGASSNQLASVSRSSVYTGVGSVTNSTGVWNLAERQ